MNHVSKQRITPYNKLNYFSNRAFLVFFLCVDHDILIFEIGKLALNFEILFTFFCLIEKKDELPCNIFIEIIQPFLYLDGAPRYISQQQKYFNIQHQFQNNMIHALLMNECLN